MSDLVSQERADEFLARFRRSSSSTSAARDTWLPVIATTSSRGRCWTFSVGTGGSSRGRHRILCTEIDGGADDDAVDLAQCVHAASSRDLLERSVLRGAVWRNFCGVEEIGGGNDRRGLVESREAINRSMLWRICVAAD